MPSHYDSENCPAGLDNLTSEPSNSSITSVTTTSDGYSYVKVRKSTRPVLSDRRALRLPLTDRSLNSNLTASRTLGDEKSLFMTTQDCAGPTPSPHGSHIEPASFPRLPPLPHASSLQLPSFLDFSIHTTIIDPYESIFKSLSPLSFSVPHSHEEHKTEGTAEASSTACSRSMSIPPFMHSNSPYVPWDPQLRRDILRPLTPASRMSHVSDCYSRPYSRTGAQAPEPMDFPEAPVQRIKPRFLKVSKGFKSLASTVRKNIQQVAKQISLLKKPLRSTTEVQTRPISPVPFSSAESFDSSDTTTLATWLADRRRLAADRERDVSNGILLEEYERTGSWLNLPGTFPRAVNPTPRGDISQTRRPSSLVCLPNNTPRHSAAFQSRSESQLSGPFCDVQVQCRSASASPNRTPGSVLTSREREMSMPGGWTFNH
ncbi:hypothetical protein Hypma_015332 [Hypsizygus marmoreus]|uniref:Uncharacterized protein n=1 Tax=Hypsizygus marmoreus TaxID=39966 RepID=A0A369KAA0_HYPMA|nr:hypothetical protein Hypma_015332 [Hypsizygus marmoreus]